MRTLTIFLFSVKKKEGDLDAAQQLFKELKTLMAAKKSVDDGGSVGMLT